MAKSPTIKINIRANANESVALLRADISSIVERLNENPPRINISVDEQALTASIRAAVQNATATIGNIGGGGVGNAGAGGNFFGGGNRNRNPVLVHGSAAYNRALTRVENLRGQVQGRIHSWTAASDEDINSLEETSEAAANLSTNLQTGQMRAEQFETALSDLRARSAGTSADIKELGQNTKSLATRFTEMAKIAVPLAALRAVREMVDEAQEIESSLAQLQIVTGAPDSALTDFLSRAVKLSKELGQSVSDVLKSIETFSRLGYSEADASVFAKYAGILANVADTSVSAATTGLTSIIKGYGLDVSDAEHVADVLVEVGKKYAISAEELMEAYERGGAALNAAGVSFEQSAGLFAAANAALQNASSVGTLWKTVSARIRGAKTELEALGEDTYELVEGMSKYRDEYKALTGVDLMVDEDTYQNIFKIFTETAAVWDTLSDVSQARIAEILGGTRQLSGVASTLQNISDAVGAYSTALDSAGASEKANEIFMETSAAKAEVMKAAFSELSAALIDTDRIGTLYSIATALLEGATAAVKLTDNLNLVLAALIGIAAAKTPAAIARITREVERLVTSGQSLYAMFQTGNFSWGAIEGIIGTTAAAATIAISAGMSVYKQYYEQQRESSEEAEKSASSSVEYADALLSLQKRADSGTESAEDLTSAFEEQLREMGYAEDAIDRLTKRYASLSTAIQGVTSDTLKQAQIDANTARVTAGNALASHVWDNLSLYVPKGNTVNKDLNDALNAVFEKAGKDAGTRYFSQYMPEASWGANSKSAEDIYAFLSGVYEAKDLIEQYANDTADDTLLESEMYKQLGKVIKQYADDYELYKNALQSKTAADARLVVNGASSSVKTHADYNAFIKDVSDSEEYTDELKAEILSVAEEAFPNFAASASRTGEDVKSLGASLEALSSASSSVSALSSLFSDLTESGAASVSTLSAIKEAANLSGSEWEKYQSLLISGEAGTAEYGAALNALVYKILAAKMGTDELASATEDEIAAVLRENDVANASTLAQSYIARAKAETAAASLDLETASYSEVSALAEESSAAGFATQTLVYLLQKKVELAQNKIDTAAEVRSLITLATAAGASAEAISRLNEINSLLSSGNLSVGDLRRLESLREEFYKGGFDFGFEDPFQKASPTSSAAKETAAEIRGEISETKKKLQELDTEARLDNLNESIEAFELTLDNINSRLDVLSDKLDLTSEKDYAARLSILSDELSLSSEKGASLRAEFERLRDISPATADEAEAIASALENVGKEMRDNAKTLIDTGSSLRLLSFTALSEEAQSISDNISEVEEAVSRLVSISTEESINGISDAFSALNYLLPTSDVDAALSRQRSLNDKLQKDAEETENAITAAKKAALDKQYEENAAERERLKKEYAKDLTEYQNKLDAALAVARSSAENTASSVKSTFLAAADDVAAAFDYSASSVENRLKTLAEKAEEYGERVRASYLFGDAFSQSSQSYSSSKSGAISTKTTALSSGDKYATGAGGCVTYVREWLKNNDFSTYVPASGGYSGVTANAKTKHNSQSVAGENIDAMRSALGRGAVIAVSAGPNVSSQNVGHLLVVTGYNPQSDILTVSEHCYTASKGDWLESSSWKLEDFLKAYTVTWTTPANSYAEGTKSHPGGLALVGENHRSGRKGGAELAVFPDGTAAVLGEDGAGVYDLPKGTEIIDHDKTKKILRGRSYAEGTSSIDDISANIYGAFGAKYFSLFNERLRESSALLKELNEAYSSGSVKLEEYSSRVASLSYSSARDTALIQANLASDAYSLIEERYSSALEDYNALLQNPEATADEIAEARDLISDLKARADDLQQSWRSSLETFSSSAESYVSSLDKANEDERSSVERALSANETAFDRIDNAVSAVGGGAVNELQGIAEKIGLLGEREGLLRENLASLHLSASSASSALESMLSDFEDEWREYFGSSGYSMLDIFNADGSLNSVFDALSSASEGEAQTFLQYAAKNLAAPLERLYSLESDISSAEDDILSNASEISDLRLSMTEEIYSRVETAYERTEEKIDKEIEKNEYLNSILNSRLDAMKTYHELQRSISSDMTDYLADLESSKLLSDWLDPEARELLFNTEDFDAMREAAENYSSEIEDAYRRYQNQISSVSEGEEDYLDIYAEQYNLALESAKKTYELSKLELDVAKKRKTLENALNERNVRQFVGGRWVYTSNASDVQSAVKDLTAASASAEEKRREIEDATEEGKLSGEISENETRIANLNIDINNLSSDLETLGTTLSDKVLEPLDELGDVLSWVTNYDYANEDILGNGILYTLMSRLAKYDPTALTKNFNAPYGETSVSSSDVYAEPNYRQAADIVRESEEGLSEDAERLEKYRDLKRFSLGLEDSDGFKNAEIYAPDALEDAIAEILGGATSERLRAELGEGGLSSVGKTLLEGASSPALSFASPASAYSQSLADAISDKLTECAEYTVRELAAALTGHWLNIENLTVRDDYFSDVMKSFDALYSVRK